MMSNSMLLYHLALPSYTSLSLIHTGSTELNASALHEVALEHLEMNINDVYGTNTDRLQPQGT